MKILVEYPSWNPYSTPTIGNLRCYALGRFCYNLLNKKNLLVDREYFVNDFSDPSVLDSYNNGELIKSKLHSDILKILEEKFKFFHEVELQRIRKTVILILSQKKLIYSKDGLIQVRKPLPYGSKEILINNNKKPLYFLNDLCYGFKKNLNYDLIYSFMGEDQKKHALNLLDISREIGVTSRKIVLYGLVYKNNRDKYSKRKGDKLDLNWFFENRSKLLLFFNNKKTTNTIKNFEEEFFLWCNKNKKPLLNLELIPSLRPSGTDCNCNQEFTDLYLKTTNQLLEEGIVQPSPIVERIFYYFSKIKRICCSKKYNEIKEAIKLVGLS